jgi:coproporphyrinogen III oxidase
MREKISSGFRILQDDICGQLEAEDGKGRFKEDLWERPGGGGGRTRVLTGGDVIEKGGVNFSAVHGSLSPAIQKALELPAPDFFATGVSIVIHPNSPHVPIIHMNVRYFEAGDRWWFGGGIDLTPHYVVRDQARYFHQQLRTACLNHNEIFYPRFKQWADDYFYIAHRKETRGIGGIFFDRLGPETATCEALHSFVADVGNTFAPTYRHLMSINRHRPHTEHERQWQLLRRGRYVEFNLVYDKGTRFGLDTHGRIESILMSLPALAAWEYDFRPETNSREEETLNLLRKGIDWSV